MHGFEHLVGNQAHKIWRRADKGHAKRKVVDSLNPNILGGDGHEVFVPDQLGKDRILVKHRLAGCFITRQRQPVRARDERTERRVVRHIDLLFGLTAGQILLQDIFAVGSILYENSAFVVRLGVLDLISQVSVPGGQFRRQAAAPGVDKIVCVHRALVGPQSIPAEMEHEFRRVLIDVPTLGDTRDRFLRLRIVLGETLEDRHVESRLRLPGRHGWVERFGFRAGDVPHDLPLGRGDTAEVLAVGRDVRTGCQPQCQDDAQPEAGPCSHVAHVPLLVRIWYGMEIITRWGRDQGWEAVGHWLEARN